ncbi:hypothetical protein QYF36_003407 [Acer negundo]|nr:hypothetical protein QYF36_003407 [Acer negundo]
MYNDISLMQKPYQAVIVEGKWKALKEFFDNDEGFTISYPIMTVAKDNAFHIAVQSKSDKPLKQLLERLDMNFDHITNLLNTTNAYENTVLHEAAINHNIKAVKLLVEGKRDTPDKQLLVEERGYVTPQHLLERNKSGQTPLFKAAAFGSTKVVKYLASQPYQMTCDNYYEKLQDAHRTKNDGTSILHAAVQGEQFGTALCLLKLDKGLAELKNRKGMTSIPTGGDYNDDADNVDVDHENNVKVADNDGRWPTARKIWKEKRKHKFAFKLAYKLIKNDHSWQRSYTEDTLESFKSLNDEGQVQILMDSNDPGTSLPKKLAEITIEDNKEDKEDESETAEDKHQVETPLLAATRTGVIELVKEILKEHPQAVEHVSHKKQNILHLAASYRQREVFDLVKKMQIPTRRLILGIDKESYTVLHHVADTKNYKRGTRPGPAYQLQEELEWFKSVEDIMPSYFTQHHDIYSKTAKELFREKHETQLQEAQKWIKETSQSCSGVAVLVATVVFAAAFTVPGGTNDKDGLPILLHTPFFMFFTVMDVVSLSCSLTAVVMFLSIITSPFELDNFRVSLPRRLTLGFALLFMSVATTMLAFTSTIFLIIRSEQRRRWTLTLICSAAFVPVSVLALTHFPLFVSFIRAWNNIFKLIGMTIPYNLLLQILTFLGKLVYPLGLFIKELGLCKF